jgi:hypothetical protein
MFTGFGDPLNKENNRGSTIIKIRKIQIPITIGPTKVDNVSHAEPRRSFAASIGPEIASFKPLLIASSMAHCGSPVPDVA